MYCCPECFSDRSLRRDIFPLSSQQSGKCSYCGSDNVPLVKPTALAEYFELLVSSYEPDPEGKLLVQCFREDWGLFENPRMDDAHAKELLSEILDDVEVVRHTFKASFSADGNHLGDWDELREELRYRNRFFPKVNIEYDRLAKLLSFLASDQEDIQRKWFRARIQNGNNIYVANEMGAPPRERATHGRANPAGIPYLYLASNELTAISEIRPHTGEIACVADFEVPTDLKLIDLRNPKKMVSPFLFDDPIDIGQLHSDLPFLERLGQELTRPVLPYAAAIDYTPSQFFCEFIKGQGYDGVLYRSSVTEGINLALFDPTQPNCNMVRQFSVNRVAISAEVVNNA
jgi:RES domain